MSSVLNLILTHQPAPAVARMVDHWSAHGSRESILIAYGGSEEGFDAIAHPSKFFVADQRLRTRDHQREFQSYTGLFRSAAELLKKMPYEFVRFSEYDHVPIAKNLDAQQIKRLHSERADMLGYHLHRVDGTSNPHYLSHICKPDFARFWRRTTRRDDPDVVLSCMGTGTFWTREAFSEVTAVDEPIPIYMEIFLPTLAHHLGFRVRDVPEQNPFVHAHENAIVGIEEAKTRGAWTLHPIKRIWEV